MSKLNHIYVVDGTLDLVSGTRVGGGDNGSKIGGCDSPVIRNKMTGDPYIPGSSIKGKMRSMLEAISGIENKPENRKTNKETNISEYTGEPCRCGRKDCMICTIFGAHMNTKAKSGRPRLHVIDMDLNQEFKDDLLDDGKGIEDIVEIKTSTMIGRKNGTAADGSLRNEERVVGGAVFDAKMTISIYDGDDEKLIVEKIKKAIELVEADGIGSKTSSGSGKIKFDLDWKHCYDVVTDKEYSL